MNVIILTVFIGLLLVTFFVGFFLYLSSNKGSIERDALMPLQEEKPRVAGPRGINTSQCPPSSAKF